MPSYRDKEKEAAVARLMPPHNESLRKVASETGISEASLRRWKRQAMAEGSPNRGEAGSRERWSSQDKFRFVLETATLSEVELAEYCRSKGLYVEQVHAWRDACMQANGGVAQEADRLRRELRQKEAEIKRLEREARRKDAALAETTALLVLRKKADAIWGDVEGA